MKAQRRTMRLFRSIATAAVALGGSPLLVWLLAADGRLDVSEAIIAAIVVVLELAAIELLHPQQEAEG